MEKGTDSAGKPIMQQAHVHEVGHLMGFDHVDVGKPHCPADQNTNAAACYGVADVDKNSVMGSGMQLRVDHAMPWRKAIVQLLGKGNLLLANRLAPKLKRHYPRKPEEVAGNAAITTRPRR
jgi:predicted metal-dependent phosphotriesterase family hydrolase